MRRTSLLILLFLPVFLGGLSAGGLSAAEPLTEGAFLAAVGDAHPASRALVGDLGAAEARRLRASLLSDPRLEVTREAPEGAPRETTWGVAWTPPVDGRRRWAVGAAEASVAAERYGLESRLSLLRFELRGAYAAWAAGQRRVSLMAEHSGRLEALAERIRNRADAGEESTLAARRLEIAFDSSRVALSRARAEEAGLRTMAAGWLDDSDRDLSAMETQLSDLPPVPEDLDSDVDWALRPDVLAARARIEESDSLLRLARRVPAAPELMLGWKSIEEDLGRNSEGPVVALAWSIPLFDRRRADKMAAESAVAVAVAEEEWATRRAGTELAAAVAGYEELRKSALSAHDDLEGLIDVALAATAAFEQGESTVTDLLDTLQALLGIRLATLDLHAAALEAHRQLEVAAHRSLTSGDKS